MGNDVGFWGYIGFVLIFLIVGGTYVIYRLLQYRSLQRRGEKGKSQLGESLRDRTRDDICFGLRSLGIDAQMAKRGRAEEKIRPESIPFLTGITQSLGVIDIPEGAMRWVNVVRRSEEYGSKTYYTVYGVPDPRVDESLRVIHTPAGVWGGPPEIKTPEIKALRMQYSPLVGKVVDLRWNGDDFGLGIIDRLNGDISIKQPIVMSHDVTICAVPDHRCWMISTETGRPPSRELWSCYQTIAQHLLAEWSPSSREDEQKGVGSQ